MRTFGVVARKKAPDGYTGVWVNIYKRRRKFYAGGTYETRAEADLVAKWYRYDCIFIWIVIDSSIKTV